MHFLQPRSQSLMLSVTMTQFLWPTVNTDDPDNNNIGGHPLAVIRNIEDLARPHQNGINSKNKNTKIFTSQKPGTLQLEVNGFFLFFFSFF